jgi:YHS domain-containing protein
MARCAVCGKDTGPESPGGSETYNDQTYGFCDAKCKAEFDRNPERYGEKTATDAHG